MWQLLQHSPFAASSWCMKMYWRESRSSNTLDASWLRTTMTSKLCVIWACVGQVLQGENASPCVAAKFYKAVVQSVLLYGSEMWNLTKAVFARLKGFYICASYGMAREHKPHNRLFGKWKYPSKKDVLKECGLHSVKDYIDTHRSTIAINMVNHPIFRECKEGEQRRGSMPRQWWWEQELGLDV
jgi:hypothetical protein